jgi:uncharacterized protein YceH (UPF0502 family)
MEVEQPGTPTWPVLSVQERRILGVLIEKQKTSKSADAYPLTLNSLLTGCNQKSNRDPVLDLSDLDVEEALSRAMKRGLVARVTGARAERFRHLLYEQWKLAGVEMAIMAELLLRGPQTEGELRGRASRMDAIDDLETLRGLVRGLADRGLVVYLSPEGRRGTTVTHGFHPPEELETLRSRFGAAALDEPEPAAPTTPPRVAPAPAHTPTPAPVVPDLEPRLQAAQAEIAALRQEVEQLRATITQLSEQMRAVREALGMPG